MGELKLEHLERSFGKAMEQGVGFMGVAVTLPNAEGIEVIINSNINFKYKLDYYKNAYNDDLTHKHALGVKIVGFAYGESFDMILNGLMGA